MRKSKSAASSPIDNKNTKKRRSEGGEWRSASEEPSPRGPSRPQSPGSAQTSRSDTLFPAPLRIVETTFQAVGEALSPMGAGLRATVHPIKLAARGIARARKLLLRDLSGALGGDDGMRAEGRVILVGAPNPNFVGNDIKTSKYNVLTFLPIFLFEMFSRAAYLYFLVQACLAWWKVVSPFGGWGSTLALLFVLGVAAVKALFEDIKRHQQDAITNNSVAHCVNPHDGSVSDIKWRDVKVGQVLRVNDDELFPADLVCLYSALEENVCFIKTTNLDGETNLKIRKPVDLKDDAPANLKEALDMQAEIHCEGPNANLHSFKGRFVIQTGVSGERVVPLTTHELLLRECTLKNSGYILGAVVYTGPESRIQMNSAKTPNKVGSYDHFLNFQIAFVIVLQMAMCIFCAVASLVWRNQIGWPRYYLALESQTQGNFVNGAAYTFILLITFWILFSYLVPISLFVTLEIVKFWQGFIYVNWDREMVDPATGENALARNTNLNEDLGKIDYVFSDKTGTLTSNEMQLRQSAIKGVIFGDPDMLLEADVSESQEKCLGRWAPDLLDAVEAAKSRGCWETLVKAGGSPQDTLALESSRVNQQVPAKAVASTSGAEEPGKGVEREGIDGTHNRTASSGGPSVDSVQGPLSGEVSQSKAEPSRSSIDLGSQKAPGDQAGGVGTSQVPGGTGEGSRGKAASGGSGPSGTAQSPVTVPKDRDGSAGAGPSNGSGGALGGTVGSTDSAGQAQLDRALLASHMLDYWMNICVCHSLIVEKAPDGSAMYQGPSPDEVALVEGARRLGFEVVGRTQSGLRLRMMGTDVHVEVLNVLEYSSARARMSVIARMPDDTVRLFCKGSDSKIMDMIRSNSSKTLVDAANLNLHSFATRGLRTLAMGTKVLDKGDWRRWDAAYQQAASLLEGRDEALADLAAEVEGDLELVGISAIEDKLQDGVPEAIQTLLDAGMRVWMITGDKQETAINIAISCRLIHHPDDLLICNAHDPAAAAALLEELQATLDSRQSPGGQPHRLPTVRDGPVLSDLHVGELVIDGPTLAVILGSDLEPKLAHLGAGCAAVVICRSSPSQKAGVVRMMAQYEMRTAEGNARGLLRWYRGQMKKQAGRMLAIGDGANDVAMIQAADVGVGIMGKEGRQAVNSSDFAISQFRFLVRLLLVHGCLDAYRLSRLIKYSFYKNVVFGFMLFYFQFYCGFSGQAMVDDITAAAFNVLFTSVPIMLFGIMDRPVKKLDTLMRYPQTYSQAGNLTTAVFWKTGVVMAVVDAALCFFVCYYGMNAPGSFEADDVYSVGMTTYIAILGAVTLEMGIVARYWTFWFTFFTFLSYFGVFPFLVLYPMLLEANKSFNVAQYGVMVTLLGSVQFWMSIIACYFGVFGHRFAERTCGWIFNPQDTMILEELEVLEGRDPEHGWQTANRLSRLRSRASSDEESGGKDKPPASEETTNAAGVHPRPSVSRPSTPGESGNGVPAGLGSSLISRISGTLSREPSASLDALFSSRPQSPPDASHGGDERARRPGRLRRAWDRLRVRQEEREQESVRRREETRVQEAVSSVNQGLVESIRHRLEQGSGPQGGIAGVSGGHAGSQAVATIQEERSVEMVDIDLSEQARD